jgi:hypothetical protein
MRLHIPQLISVRARPARDVCCRADTVTGSPIWHYSGLPEVITPLADTLRSSYPLILITRGQRNGDARHHGSVYDLSRQGPMEEEGEGEGRSAGRIDTPLGS